MKIMMACGGTGGHIFPAFSVAEEIKERDISAEIVYVCGKLDIENAIFKIVSDEKVVSVESAPFRGARSLFSPIFLIKLIQGLWQSFRILQNEKPDLVTGFGGYFAFPIVLVASWMRIPTLIHEQNVIPGKANKALAGIVDGVALSFPETRQWLDPKGECRVTGNPVRLAIERDCRPEALRFFGFDDHRVTLLVLGGSQGAESINVLFLGALPLMADSVKNKIQVVHLCGRMAATTAEEALKKHGVLGKAYSFFERMDLIYSVSDLALGRAGATFLSEISVKKIPAILIPYPSADEHQLANAKAFCRGKDSVYREQKDLTSGKLAEELVHFINKVFAEKSGQTDIRQNGHAEQVNSRSLLADYMVEKLRKNER